MIVGKLLAHYNACADFVL